MTDAELDQHRIALVQARADVDRLYAAHQVAQSRWSKALIEEGRLNDIVEKEERHRTWLKEYEAGLRGVVSSAETKEASS